MSKKLLIGIVVLSCAFIGSSFAAIENIKVSGDMTAQALTRDLSLGAVDGNAVDSEDFIFSQIRLKFGADLTENVGAVIGLINERVWGNENTTTTGEATEVDLDLAYLELKEFLYQPLSLTVGRQNLRYGSGLIVGDPDTNQGTSPALTTRTPNAISDLSLRKSFDAVKLVLDYSPCAVDLVYAKIDEGVTSTAQGDVGLTGVNVGYTWDAYNGLTEGYFFLSDNERAVTAGVKENQSNTYVVGLRNQMNPNDHLTLALESAFQAGDHYQATPINTNVNYSNRKAYAAIASTEYRFLNDSNTKVGASYSFLSGDNPNSDDFEGWDPMYEDTAPGEIINALFAASNCHIINVTGAYMPKEDVTLGFSYARAILAEKLPDSNTAVEGNAAAFNTYSPVLGPARNLTTSSTYAINNGERVLGDEVDVYAVYDYTEDVQLKLTGACFLPGNFFSANNSDNAYSLKGGLTVNF